MSWDDFRTAPPSTKVKEPLVRIQIITIFTVYLE